MMKQEKLIQSNTPAARKTIYETLDPNDLFSQAQEINEDDDIIGIVDEKNDVDWYKVKFNANGKANFYLEPNQADLDVDLEIYNDSNVKIASSANASGVHELVTIEVVAGKYYYIKVKHFGVYDRNYTYVLRCKNYPSSDGGTGDVTGGSSFSTATPIKLFETVTVAFDRVRDTDFFKLQFPEDVDCTAVKIITEPHGGDYSADFYVYNKWEEGVGYILAEFGSVGYLTIPRPSDSIYIKVVHDGAYVASNKTKYDLTVVPIAISADLIKADISEFKLAYDIKEGECVRGAISKTREEYYEIIFEENQKIRFVVQPEVDLYDFKVSIHDKDRRQLKLIEGSSFPLSIELNVEAGQPYAVYIRPYRNSQFDSSNITYTLHTERVGIGGASSKKPAAIKFLSIKPTVTPPYRTNTVHNYNVEVKNIATRDYSFNIEAKLRDENITEHSAGFTIGESGKFTLKAGETTTISIPVRHAKSGFKDIVFQEKNQLHLGPMSINVEIGLSAGGYNIATAISQLKELEAFIENELKSQNGGVAVERHVINQQVILVISEFLYDGREFPLFIQKANSKVKKAVDDKYEDTIKREMINNTILNDPTGRTIDWVHMFAVLAGCAYRNPTTKGEEAGFYTGWLGDILSEVPNLVNRVSLGAVDGTNARGTISERALKAAVFEKCSEISSITCGASLKDLEADVDAVVVNGKMGIGRIPISKIIESYYSSVSNSRYQTFKSELCRVGNASSFETVVLNGVDGQYDGQVPMGLFLESEKLSGFKSKDYRIEIGRLFAEYINSNGRIVRGADLTWNNSWA